MESNHQFAFRLVTCNTNESTEDVRDTNQARDAGQQAAATSYDCYHRQRDEVPAKVERMSNNPSAANFMYSDTERFKWGLSDRDAVCTKSLSIKLIGHSCSRYRSGKAQPGD